MATDDRVRMDREIARLVYRWQVVEVMNAYAFHFDRNEPEAVGQLFESDATIDYGPEMETIKGSEALIEVITRGLTETFAATSHHISNASVQFDNDDSARLVAYLHAWHRYHDGSPDGYLWGQYHTRLRRTEDQWRFAQMTLRIAGSVDFHRTSMHGIGRRPPE